MDNEQTERLVLSFESIAHSLEGIHEQAKKAGTRFWSDPREPREPVFSRIPTEDDLARERQGASNKPIEEWLSELSDEQEFLGERTRQWYKDHHPPNISPKTEQAGIQDAPGVGDKTVKGQA